MNRSFNSLVSAVDRSARQTVIAAGQAPEDFVSNVLRAEAIRELAAYGLTTTGSLGEDYKLLHEAAKSLKTLRQQREEAVAKEQFKQDAAEAQYYLTDEFRQEVMDEIIAEGATPLQAQGRTRDQAHLFAEAQRLGLM